MNQGRGFIDQSADRRKQNMRYQEVEYRRFLTLLQDKYIVCIGLGKYFERYKSFFLEKGLHERIIALVDNDERKHGMRIELADQVFYVKNLEELISMRQDHEFMVLVISTYYQEICEQIESREELCDLEVLDALYTIMDRRKYLTAYTNLFKEACGGIGKQGENMTISVLMHNRAELTIRLLDSIEKYMPAFCGEILFGDNGSDKEELERLESRLKRTELKCGVIQFDEHYPIPVGKNKLNWECQTDWILQLDNDIYFTDNPIQKIGEDIGALGCRMWGLPYYDTGEGRVANYGSNLEFQRTDSGERELACLIDLPFAEDSRLWEPMLCTYAAGCAVLMDKKLFFALGGYDENLFVNEDIDLMYRANMQGYKIGNIGMRCLVHDHKRIDSRLGREYEAVRFDEKRLAASKEYLRGKYGFDFQ